jgi:hypothetical protein
VTLASATFLLYLTSLATIALPPFAGKTKIDCVVAPFSDYDDDDLVTANDACKLAKSIPQYGECSYTGLDSDGLGVYVKSTCGSSTGFIIGVVVLVLVLVGGGSGAYIFVRMRGANSGNEENMGQEVEHDDVVRHTRVTGNMEPKHWTYLVNTLQAVATIMQVRTGVYVKPGHTLRHWFCNHSVCTVD